MKVYRVTLTVEHTVLMEAEDEREAREVMATRCAREILGRSHEIEAVETKLKPEEYNTVLRA